MKEIVIVIGVVFIWALLFITNAILIYKGVNGWGWFFALSCLFIFNLNIDIPTKTSSCNCENNNNEEMVQSSMNESQ